MQRLSSRWTPLSKFVLPGGPAIFLPGLYLHCFEDKAFIIPAILLTGLVFLFVAWARLIKVVEVGGGEFTISNYKKRIAVPVWHLSMIIEDKYNRTPSIDLIFDPPTEFGRVIRIVPPIGFFSYRTYDAVTVVLREILRCRQERMS
jgi:hypothetical protein